MSKVMCHKCKHKRHYRKDCPENDNYTNEDKNRRVAHIVEALEVVEDIFIDGDLASTMMFVSQDHLYDGCMLNTGA